MEITHSVTAPLEGVFAYMAAAGNWPAFRAEIVDLADGAPRGLCRSGAEIGVVARLLGRRLPGRCTVQEFGERDRLVFSQCWPGVPDITQRWVFDETEDGCTIRATLDVERKGRLFGAAVQAMFLPRVLERDLRWTLENVEAIFAVAGDAGVGAPAPRPPAPTARPSGGSGSSQAGLPAGRSADNNGRAARHR